MIVMREIQLRPAAEASLEQLNAIGRPTRSNPVLISRLAAMACSISLRAFHRRSGMNQERLWPRGTLSSCTDDFDFGLPVN